MLFERRAYTLRPGNAERFWRLQELWNTPAQIPGVLARNIGYFETVAGPAEQIVHLYRYDSFDDWKKRLFGAYTPEREEYFTAGRKLMSAQENTFLALAPIAEINPIWNETADWLPGRPVFQDAVDLKRLVVVETTIDFVPGGLAAYWTAYRQFGLSADPPATRHIACFYTLVGQQHRVIQYRWHQNAAESQEYLMQRDASPLWRSFLESHSQLVARSQVTYLRPSPVAWLRSLFTLVGPYSDEAKQP